MRVLVFLLSLLASVPSAHTAPLPQRLSDWKMFEREGSSLRLAPSVIIYDLATPLFSDYASKLRVLRLPAGTTVAYNSDDVLDFPEGTVIAKTFAYRAADLKAIPTALGVRVDAGDLFPGTSGDMILIETRILVRQPQGWLAIPYIWKPELDDAVLSLTGGRQDLVLAHDDGPLAINYQVPNANLCRSCHVLVDGYTKRITPIGPSARQLNRSAPRLALENQLQTWANRGMLTGLPDIETVPKLAEASDPSSGTLAERARAYLDSNCAHCHRSHGLASSSGLLLSSKTTDPRQLGVCKSPVAAGNGGANAGFDIEPGHPESSLLYQRLRSTDPSTRMPEVGRSVVDTQGLALIGDWIASMSGSCR